MSAYLNGIITHPFAELQPIAGKFGMFWKTYLHLAIIIFRDVSDFVSGYEWRTFFARMIYFPNEFGHVLHFSSCEITHFVYIIHAGIGVCGSGGFSFSQIGILGAFICRCLGLFLSLLIGGGFYRRWQSSPAQTAGCCVLPERLSSSFISIGRLPGRPLRDDVFPRF